MVLIIGTKINIYSTSARWIRHEARSAELVIIVLSSLGNDCFIMYAVLKCNLPLFSDAPNGSFLLNAAYFSIP